LSAQLLCLAEAPADKIKQSNLIHTVFERHPNAATKYEFSELFPSIYIEEKSQITQICNELKSALAKVANVECPDKVFAPKYQKRQVSTTTAAPTTVAPTSAPSDDCGSIIQITIWISVVMVAFLLLAFYMTIYMDQDYDSKIWRQESKPHHKTL